jgi:hypothetical protein
MAPNIRVSWTVGWMVLQLMLVATLVVKCGSICRLLIHIFVIIDLSTDGLPRVGETSSRVTVSWELLGYLGTLDMYTYMENGRQTVAQLVPAYGIYI